MYLENTSGFGGEGELLAKFGVEVRESANFVVARKRWMETVGRTGNTVLENRPAEGDLLYFPLTKSFFEIRKVEGRTPFYQLGKLYTFTLQCELYQFSNERVDTGITEIDSIIDSLDKDILAYEILLESGDTLLLEEYSDSPLIQESYSIQNVDPLADNVDFTAGINDILDFSEKNPFGEAVR
jgi:hypothetical protein